MCVSVLYNTPNFAVVVSGDRLDSNLVYFFCNPTGVLPLFLFLLF